MILEQRNADSYWQIGPGIGGGVYNAEDWGVFDANDKEFRLVIDGGGKVNAAGLQAFGNLLSTTNVALDADGDTTIYTVPTGKTLIPTMALLVAGASAGATLLSIGQNGAESDFVPAQNLEVLAAAGDFVELKPFRCIYLTQISRPVKKRYYSAGTVIQAKVASSAGGDTNSLYFFGFLV